MSFGERLSMCEPNCGVTPMHDSILCIVKPGLPTDKPEKKAKEFATIEFHATSDW